jgi:hypothetical protein
MLLLYCNFPVVEETPDKNLIFRRTMWKKMSALSIGSPMRFVTTEPPGLVFDFYNV